MLTGVTRMLDPVRENVGGLIQRADKHGQRLAELEQRLAALERKQAQKGGAVVLHKARER